MDGEDAVVEGYIMTYNLDLFGRCVLICVIIGSVETCKQMNLDLFG